MQKVYRLFPNAKYFGFCRLGAPMIVIRDPELFASIAIKNFDQFCDHQGFVDEDADPLMGKNLLVLWSDRWREVRKLRSPWFTSSKMKNMFKLICECADNLSDVVASESENGKVYDSKDMFGRYT